MSEEAWEAQQQRILALRRRLQVIQHLIDSTNKDTNTSLLSVNAPPLPASRLEILDEAAEEAVIAQVVQQKEASGQWSGLDTTGLQRLDTVYLVTPPAACAINADVTQLDWKSLGAITRFDAVVIDPPWDLVKGSASRGVDLGYDVLTDDAMRKLPIGDMVANGLVFLWGINSKWNLCMELLQTWGFEFLKVMHWVKLNRYFNLAMGHGYYLLHAKEPVFVGVKGKPPLQDGFLDRDVICAYRQKQSAKPEALYEWIERLIPDGKFLDVFARMNSLRTGWVSIGNELNTAKAIKAAQTQELRWRKRQRAAALQSQSQPKRKAGASITIED